METVLAFAAILGAAYFVTIIDAAFVTALIPPRHPQLQLNLLKWLKSNTGETIET